MNTTTIILLVLLVCALAILFIASEWRVFQKAGKPGWASIIPFYNGWTLARVGGKPGWWGLLAGLSVTVNINGTIPFGVVVALGAVAGLLFILWLLIALGVARNFGKSAPFGFLLGILPFIGYPILGFGSAQYAGQVRRKEQKSIIILIVLLTLILFGGGLTAYYVYGRGDHSVYAKLATENYDNGGMKFAFDYPQIMKLDTTELNQLQKEPTPGYQTPVLYADKLTGTPTILIAANVYDITPVLQQFNLTPSQLMSQVQKGSGSYVDALNSQSANGYYSKYDKCGPTITNNAGQTSLVCSTIQDGEKRVDIFGFTNQKQYNLQFFMPVQTWNDHKTIWNKIERSFTYQ